MASAMLALLLATQVVGLAAAEAYPSRPIKIVVPYAVGGATDLITRVVAQSLAASLGVDVVVENRAGGGRVTSKAVSLAEPDGYTLLTATNGPFAIGPAVYPNVGYDPIRSFAPIQLGIEILAPLLLHMRAGKLKPLAVTGAQRSPELPDVPTLIESGFPGAAFIAAFGIVAPAGMPPEIVAKLNRAINDGLGSEQMKTTLAKIGFQSNIGTPQDLAAFIADEIARWAEVAKIAHVKID
jgi:tripartite-type tricarboxylate transporter receptor subunit TctC